jgi:hypothetical protein
MHVPSIAQRRAGDGISGKRVLAAKFALRCCHCGFPALSEREPIAAATLN